MLDGQQLVVIDSWLAPIKKLVSTEMSTRKTSLNKAGSKEKIQTSLESCYVAPRNSFCFTICVNNKLTTGSQLTRGSEGSAAPRARQQPDPSDDRQPLHRRDLPLRQLRSLRRPPVRAGRAQEVADRSRGNRWRQLDGEVSAGEKIIFVIWLCLRYSFY